MPTLPNYPTTQPNAIAENLPTLRLIKWYYNDDLPTLLLTADSCSRSVRVAH
ncbi:MAG: hypothetical protein F6K38_30650 [Moorea sp. SIO3B2]|nr:hypothetical protein [Moorena sp. SIO3B2]